MAKRRRSESPATSRKRRPSLIPQKSSLIYESDSSSEAEPGLMPPSPSGSSSSSLSHTPATVSSFGTDAGSNGGSLSPLHPSHQPTPQDSATEQDSQDTLPAVMTCATIHNNGLATPPTVRESSHEGIIVWSLNPLVPYTYQV